MCVCTDLPACVRDSKMWDSFEQVSCFSGRNEGRGRSRRVRKKGFVPVNLYSRYFMPGCLSREKHLVQITAEEKKKMKSHAAAVVEIWNKLFMSAPFCPCLPPSALSVGFHNNVGCSGAKELLSGEQVLLESRRRWKLGWRFDFGCEFWGLKIGKLLVFSLRAII